MKILPSRKNNFAEDTVSYASSIFKRFRIPEITEIIKAIMEPWIPNEMIEFEELAKALNSLEVSRTNRRLLSVMLCTYRDHNGHILWNENSIGLLQEILFDILDLSRKSFDNVIQTGNANILRNLIISKTIGLNTEQIEEICHVLTMEA